MSSTWSHKRKVELGRSRYPPRLKWLSALVMVPVVLASQVPWWGSVMLLAALPLLLRGWSPPQPRRLELRDGELTVTGRRVQVLEKPGRVLRLGPWLAMHTPKGWLHVFEDQAPRQELQPFYQWLWLNKKHS